MPCEGSLNLRRTSERRALRAVDLHDGLLSAAPPVLTLDGSSPPAVNGLEETALPGIVRAYEHREREQLSELRGSLGDLSVVALAEELDDVLDLGHSLGRQAPDSPDEALFACCLLAHGPIAPCLQSRLLL